MGIGPGLGWGVIGILALTVLIGYVIMQETRAHHHWRGLVAGGDVEAISAILAEALEGWRRGRPPRGVSANIWSGVQTAQIVAVGPDYVRLSTGIEGQYATVDGQRREVSSSFEEAAKVTRKLADMVLYDVPDLRLPTMQIDVYSTFRDEHERPEQHCILSTIIDQERAANYDWDGAEASEITSVFDCRYRLSDDGVALPIEPLDVARQGAEQNTT